MNVALHRREHDFAARRRFGLLHELFEMIDRGLHRLGRLQNLGDDQLIVIEQPADFGHAGHQRAIDDFERARAFFAFAIEVGDQAVFGAFDDVVRQALDRAAASADLFLFLLAGSCGNVGDRRDVELIDRGSLLGRSARASLPERESPGGGVLNSRLSASRRSSTGIDAKRSSFCALTIARSSPALVA